MHPSRITTYRYYLFYKNNEQVEAKFPAKGSGMHADSGIFLQGAVFVITAAAMIRFALIVQRRSVFFRLFASLAAATILSAAAFDFMATPVPDVVWYASAPLLCIALLLALVRKEPVR